MRKILTCVIVALFCLSLPLAVHADQADSLQAMAAKLLASTAGERAVKGTAAIATADGEGYQYGAVFPYSMDSAGWVGLAVYNFSGADNTVLVGCYDATGEVAGTGSLILKADGMMANYVEQFMTAGSVPATGCIGVFATGNFMADKFVGTSSGGFSEVELTGQAY